MPLKANWLLLQNYLPVTPIRLRMPYVRLLRLAMAQAFKQAVEAGRMAYEAGLGLQADNFVAEASSPLTAFLSAIDD